MRGLIHERSALSVAARVALAGGLVALAAGSMPGCIVVKDGTRTVVVSERPAVAQDALDRIALGVTTESEVRALLGAPTSRALVEGKQVWTYRGAAASGDADTVVYIDKDGDGIRTTRVTAGVRIELTDGVVTAIRRE